MERFTIRLAATARLTAAMLASMAVTTVAVTTVAVTTVAVTTVSAEPEPRSADLEDQARGLVQQFAAELKPRLKQALATGGPTHAIEVCASEAPRIADALSEQSGWAVRRVSLRARNASRATPDDWERGILEQFDQRQAAGETAADLRASATSGGTYRYMQAQGVEGVCLVCHGESLARAIADTLEQYYPDDAATGYSMGQVRGAISLSKEL
jgi:hypothetical protein